MCDYLLKVVTESINLCIDIDYEGKAKAIVELHNSLIMLCNAILRNDICLFVYLFCRSMLQIACLQNCTEYFSLHLYIVIVVVIMSTFFGPNLLKQIFYGLMPFLSPNFTCWQARRYFPMARHVFAKNIGNHFLFF